MLRLTMMNSSGNTVTANVSKEMTVKDIVSNPEYSGVLVGTSFALNGMFVTIGDLDRPIGDLVGDNDEAVLTCVKNANSAVL